jgi:hypothetical protein
MNVRTTLAAGLLGFAGFTSAQAATLNVVFDGFCDGVSVTVTNGVAYGVETGCVSGPAVGTKGKVSSQGKGYTLNLNHVANAVFVLRTDDNTWSIYLSDGSELQSGTFTHVVGAAPAGNGKPATGQR